MSLDSQVTNWIEEVEPGAMVTRFVVVAEIIAPSGERSVWRGVQDGAMRWDTYGLLVEALTCEQAAQIRGEDVG